LIPVVGVENLAGASDTTLVTGTVIVSIPIAVGLVAGGEVILGVGTLGGGGAAAGGGAAGGGTAAAETAAYFVYLNALPIHEVYRRIMVRSLPALLASS
jgi:hypothetical protein